MPAKAKSPARLDAERLCKDFPETPTNALARRLAKEHRITVSQSRDLIRLVRGNHGAKNRPQATQPKPNGKAGQLPAIPPSMAEPWEPFDLGSGIKVAILSDAHIPYHSTTALSAAVAYCKSRRPDVVLLNGDFADFYSISRHQKDPKKRDFVAEVKAVQAGLAWIRHEFKKARIVFKTGNHEERWQHWLWNHAPEICDFERMQIGQWLEAEKHGIEVVTDQRPILAGRLPIFHGHETGKGISAPVNPARGAFLRTGSTMLVGHSHRTSQHTEPDWHHIDTTVWSTGCLCDLNPRYAVINKWNLGFAFVPVDNEGGWHVENLRVSAVNGEVW